MPFFLQIEHVFFVENYTITLSHKIVLLYTAQVDFCGRLIGRECMNCKVDMKLGWIVMMPS